MRKNIITLLSVIVIQFTSAQCYSITANIDFHEAMKPSTSYRQSYVNTNKHWATAKKLYDAYIYGGVELSNKSRIPKIIHHIWIGSHLPKYAKEFRRSWIKHHPDWTFIYWTDHPDEQYGCVFCTDMRSLSDYLDDPTHEQFIVIDIKSFDFERQHEYEHVARNYGEKSDILRYEILFKLGGLYVDTDFECYQPFDDLHHCCDFYTGIAYDRRFTLFNGLIGSKVGCQIMHAAFDQLRTKSHTGKSFSYSGPYYFTECFTSEIDSYDGKAVALPVTFLYPCPNRYRKQSPEKQKNWLRPESLALHYWKYSWAK